MGRRKADEPRDQQLMLRVTARQLEVLQSVAHLEHSKPNAYAHQVLVEHLAAMTKNPRVQADLENRAAYAADTAAAIPLRKNLAATKAGSSQTSGGARRRRTTS